MLLSISLDIRLIASIREIESNLDDSISKVKIDNSI